MYKIMTPGPTQVAENVRLARSRECTNPDLDESFVEFYKETCEEISRLLHTDNETLILGGEGILGLEAACASMTEPGDRVLVLDNGIYGKGFADFVSMYGGCPELYSRDYRETLDVQELENFLKEHHNYKYATVVHGDTPSGMLNDVCRDVHNNIPHFILSQNIFSMLALSGTPSLVSVPSNAAKTSRTL